MEELSAVEFFKLISNQKIRILVVEVGIIVENMIDPLIINDELGYIKKKYNGKPVPLYTYLQKLCEENDLKNKLQRDPCDKICYFYKKGEKKLFDAGKIKEMIAKEKLNMPFDLMQRYVQNIHESEKLITQKVSYINGEFFVEFMSGKHKVYDPIITNSLLDTATIIMSNLEQTENKRVLQMNLDYARDREGVFWLVNMQKCRLIEAKYTMDYPVFTEYDLEQLHKSIPKASKLRPLASPLQSKTSKYYDVKKPPLEEKSDYVFKKGQLRNLKSNLDSPIRVNSPELQLKEEKKSEESQSTPTNSDFPSWQNLMSPIKASSPKITSDNSIKKYLDNYMKSLSPKPHESEHFPQRDLKKHTTIYRMNNIKSLPKLTKIQKKPGYSKDFIELVMKTYCKKKSFNSSHFPEEFGMKTNLTSEEFSIFLDTVYSPKEESVTSRPPRPMLKKISEGFQQKENATRKRFEIQFLKNILENRHKLFEKNLASHPVQGRQKMINLLIASPRVKRVKK